jgi:hypothetical protein
MNSFPVYIPHAAAPKRLRDTVALIDPKSAIVSVPDLSGDELLVYFEGNRYRAANMITFADRARHAAERLATNYPTIARALVPRRALTRVGSFTPDHGVDVPDARALVALARWLELLDGERFDSDALHEQLRLSQ